jgi:ribokinase
MGVLVVGSLNIDIVTYLERMPLPGETVLGDRLEIFSGGKGLNQAVAAARSGGEVTMVGVLGNDANSTTLREVLVKEKINHDHVKEISGFCGTAVIEVDKKGQNRIIVISGANAELKAESVTEELLNSISDKKILLAQLESPISELESIFKSAKARGFYNILNPAPATNLSKEFLSVTDLLVPNQFEAEFLTGIKVVDVESAAAAGKMLIDQGVNSVLITRGEEGAVLIVTDSKSVFKAFKVSPVDTTAAGDAFCGALAVAISEGVDLDSAIRFACAAGALSVQSVGATPSLPTREQISLLIQSQKEI